MSDDELLNDLSARIVRAVDSLMDLREAPGTNVARLSGKIEGLRLVQDWLRSYRTPENVECPISKDLAP